MPTIWHALPKRLVWFLQVLYACMLIRCTVERAAQARQGTDETEQVQERTPQRTNVAQGSQHHAHAMFVQPTATTALLQDRVCCDPLLT